MITNQYGEIKKKINEYISIDESSVEYGNQRFVVKLLQYLDAINMK